MFLKWQMKFFVTQTISVFRICQLLKFPSSHVACQSSYLKHILLLLSHSSFHQAADGVPMTYTGSYRANVSMPAE